jgi:hypothetical protein
MTDHTKHQLLVIDKLVYTTSPGPIYAGRLICKQCNKQIKWASGRELEVYTKYKTQINTYEDLTKFMVDVSNSPGEGNAIYLAIPFSKKDFAKQYGAKWDNLEKLWYTYPNNKKAIYLIDYMDPSDVKSLKKS